MNWRDAMKRGWKPAALIGAALIAVIAWASVAPMGSSPDEDFHLGSIWCPLPLESHCEVMLADDGGVRAVLLTNELVQAGVCNLADRHNSGGCVDQLNLYPTWGWRFNRGENPGGFYSVMHLFADREAARGSVVAMRIFNGVLAVSLLGAAALLFTKRNRYMMAVGGMVVAAPMVIYLVASINPSSWAITGIAVSFLGLHGYFTEVTPGRRSGLLGISLVGSLMAVMARGDSAAYVSLVAVAVVALHLKRIWESLRSGQWPRRLELLAPLVTFVIGVFGFLQSPNAAAAATGQWTSAEGDGGFGLFFRNVMDLPALLPESTVGSLNWLDTGLPSITRIPLLTLAVSLLFWGLHKIDWQKALALGGMCLAFVGLPLLLLQQMNVRAGSGFQGRYVTPLVPVILFIAVWTPLRDRLARLSLVQTWVLWVVISVAHAMAFHAQIKRFSNGLDQPSFNINAYRIWWGSPVPPMQTWIIGSLAFAVLALCVFWVRKFDDAPALVPVPASETDEQPEINVDLPESS